MPEKQGKKTKTQLLRKKKLMSQKEYSFSKSILYMLLSTTFLSISYLLVKLTEVKIHFLILVFFRFFLGLVFLIIIFLFRRNFKTAFITPQWSPHFYRALAVTGSQYCLFFYLSKTNLLNAAVFMNLAPLLIPIIGKIFFHMPLGKSTIIALIISAIGVGLILHPTGEVLQWFSLVGFLAGVLWAISQVLFGVNIKEETKEASLFYLFLFATALSFPPLFFFYQEVSFKLLNGVGVLLLILMSISALLTQYFRAQAYQHGNPSRLSTFLYFSLLLSGLFDWVFFSIVPTLLTIVGAFLIILGGALKIYLRHIILKKKKDEPPL